MRIIRVDTTYDDEADAAYLAFDRIEAGEAVRQIVVADQRLGSGNVILDVDERGRLLGIEILDVTTVVARPRIDDDSETGRASS